MGEFEEEYMKDCPYCEREFQANRINQVYCNSKCKYRFNNRKRKNKESGKAPDGKRLDKNRSILKVLYDKDKQHKKKYSKSNLAALGFSFEYLTRLAKTTEGKNVIGIYDYGLFKEEDGLYKIDKIA